jgi:hypothetical protein
MCSEMPVIRATAGGICSPSGSAIYGRMRVRGCVADSGPADFKEMPSRRRSGGLTVDHQDLQMRERLGTSA